MATTIWKGHIAFGMVSFPVKLCAAARSQTVSFNQIHKCDHSRVKQVIFCQAEDKPVPRSELVKGYEYEKDRYVLFEENELDVVAPPSAKVVELLDFIQSSEVDPVYLDASYYVAPEAAGEKAYTLLFEVMRRSGYVSLGKLTMHNREHLVMLRPGRSGLILHTLFYNDEVRAVDGFRTDTSTIRSQEFELATLLVQGLAASFEPTKYRDAYREGLRELIEAKVRGEEVVPRSAPALAPMFDILEALKASLAKAKDSGTEGPKPTSTTRRSRRRPVARESKSSIPGAILLVETTPSATPS
jgi:DNA end-binding protein Ku